MGWPHLTFHIKNRTRNYEHIEDFEDRRQRVFDRLNRTHFQWLVVFVAGVGFFTDGYDIFAGSLTIPMLAHVYWHGNIPTGLETAMRTATLTGIIIGQLGFGVLADLYGRKKMYGLELLVIIIATIGVVMAGTGASNSMNMKGWLLFWRLTMGLGIGGDYPLSAVITSEFAPTKSRARMLATVFYMQPCGYLAATLVAIMAITGFRGSIPTTASLKSCTDDDTCRRAVDSAWRWVIGFGAVPAAFAIFFRFTIPESPYYTMDALNRPDEALKDMNKMAWGRATGLSSHPADEEMVMQENQQQAFANGHVHGQPVSAGEIPGLPSEVENASPNGVPPPTPYRDEAILNTRPLSHRISSDDDQITTVLEHNAAPGTGHDLPPRHSNGSDSASTSDESTSQNVQGNSAAHTQELQNNESERNRWSYYRSGFAEYFRGNGHWRTLLGTSLSWAFFDLPFYVLGPNSYKVVAKIFNEEPLKYPTPSNPSPPLPPRSIYQDLLRDCWHSLIVVSVGTMVGGAIMIYAIRRVSPRTIQFWGFTALTVLFVTIGVCFRAVPRRAATPLLACLYIIAQLVFELGPNFTTFMIPAELFKTRFRCTAHGISAASGKVAAVLVQVLIAYAPIGKYKASDPGTVWLGDVIIIFAALMFMGALVTRVLVPETRDPDGNNRELGELENVKPLRIRRFLHRSGYGMG